MSTDISMVKFLKQLSQVLALLKNPLRTDGLMIKTLKTPRDMKNRYFEFRYKELSFCSLQEAFPWVLLMKSALGEEGLNGTFCSSPLAMKFMKWRRNILPRKIKGERKCVEDNFEETEKERGSGKKFFLICGVPYVLGGPPNI